MIVFSETLDEASMAQRAGDVARAARTGDVFALHGDLGAGKSSFARAFIRACAGPGFETLDVPSPTFTLVQAYDLDVPVAHFDLYRLTDAAELDELGLVDAAHTGCVLVEWPERADPRTLTGSITVTIAIPHDDLDCRTVTLETAHSEQAARISRSLDIRAFLDGAGWTGAKRSPLLADASARTYELITNAKTRTILMDAPRLPDGPAIYDGKPYSVVARLAEDVCPFVAVAKALATSGFRAPAVHAYDLDKGLVLLEHLGDGSVLDASGAPIAQRYCDAARMLARLHSKQWNPSLQARTAVDHTIAAFGRDVFLVEAGLLAQWYVPDITGKEISAPEMDRFRAIMAGLHDTLSGSDNTLVLRDFHSPNIIWCDGDTPQERIGLIDFQDALMGPPAYDVMSLAEDARVDVPDTLREAVIAAYCETRLSLDPGFSCEDFAREAAIVAAQRACKILGIFVRLDRRDGKPAYRAHLPRVQRALKRAIRHPALGDLRCWLIDNQVIAP